MQLKPTVNENPEVSFAALSVLGDREEQQDRFGFRVRGDFCYAIVCDGMGGLMNGGMASTIAIDTFLEQFKGTPIVNEQIPGVLINCAKEADRRITEFSKTQAGSSGSTAVAVYIKNNQLFWCSSGDSRACLYRNGKLAQMTVDQNYGTVLKEKLAAGMITEREYKAEMVKGEALVSYLGVGDLSLVDYNEIPLNLRAGDRVLLMTDGLYKLLSNEEITSVIRRYSQPETVLVELEKLAAIAGRGKKRDNTTMILIKIKENEIR